MPKPESSPESGLPNLPATSWAVLGMLAFNADVSGYDIKKWADWTVHASTEVGEPMTDKTLAAAGGDGRRLYTCPLCEAVCGLAIHVKGGQVSSIRGNRDDTWSRGHICPKGASFGRGPRGPRPHPHADDQS